jgi:predicted Holliday junction resolvase-like endonuclease
MPIVDTIIIIAAFLAGIIGAYLLFSARVSIIEERARNELERWKTECTEEIRKDSVNRSRSTLKGKIAEQMAPFLPGFPYAPADARFIGSPIDFVVFDGYSAAREGEDGSVSVILVEVKRGKGKLTRGELLIKKAIEEGRVTWNTVVITDENAGGD